MHSRGSHTQLRSALPGVRHPREMERGHHHLRPRLSRSRGHPAASRRLRDVGDLQGAPPDGLRLCEHQLPRHRPDPDGLDRWRPGRTRLDREIVAHGHDRQGFALRVPGRRFARRTGHGAGRRATPGGFQRRPRRLRPVRRLREADRIRRRLSRRLRRLLSQRDPELAGVAPGFDIGKRRRGSRFVAGGLSGRDPRDRGPGQRGPHVTGAGGHRRADRQHGSKDHPGHGTRRPLVQLPGHERRDRKAGRPAL